MLIMNIVCIYEYYHIYYDYLDLLLHEGPDRGSTNTSLDKKKSFHIKYLHSQAIIPYLIFYFH